MKNKIILALINKIKKIERNSNGDIDAKIALALLNKIKKVDSRLKTRLKGTESIVVDMGDKTANKIKELKVSLEARLDDIKPIVQISGGIESATLKNGCLQIVDLAGKKYNLGNIIGEPGRPGKPGKPGKDGKSRFSFSLIGSQKNQASFVDVQNLGNGELVFFLSNGEEVSVTVFPPPTGGGGISRVVGTDNRITVLNKSIVDIASNYAGQESITVVGVVETGTWNGNVIEIEYGGTGQTTAQEAINALTQVSSATNEYILTKDTATGNAIFKSGPSTSIATEEFTNETSVVVTHNFGNFPVIQVLNDSDVQIIPFSVTHNSLNAFTVTFSSATSGTIIATFGNPAHGDSLSTTIVDVYSVDDLPTPAGGNITLTANTTYRFFNPISISDTLLKASGTRFTDMSIGNNTLTSTAANILSYQGSSGFNIMERMTIVGDGTNTLFSGTPVSVVNNGASYCVISNIASVGTLNNVNMAWSHSQISGFSTGLTLNGGGLVTNNIVGLLADATADNVDLVTIQGSWTFNIIDFLNGLMLTKSNGNAFNIDSGVTADIILADNKYVGGGTFFKSGGLDQSDPNITARNNPGFQDSATSGYSTLHGNSTVTTINTVNVWESIGVNATPSSDDERFSFLNNIYTYTGKNPTLVKISTNGAVTPAVANKSFELGVFVNDVFLADTIVTPDPVLTRGAFSGFAQKKISNGDTVEVKVRNTSNNSNITVTHLDVSIFDGA